MLTVMCEKGVRNLFWSLKMGEKVPDTYSDTYSTYSRPEAEL